MTGELMDAIPTVISTWQARLEGFATAPENVFEAATRNMQFELMTAGFSYMSMQTIGTVFELEGHEKPS